MHVCFWCVWFSFSVLSQEIGWEGHLRNNVFCFGWNVKLNWIYITFQTVGKVGSIVQCLPDNEVMVKVGDQLWRLNAKCCILQPNGRPDVTNTLAASNNCVMNHAGQLQTTTFSYVVYTCCFFIKLVCTECLPSVLWHCSCSLRV